MNEPLPSRPDASDDWLDDLLRADGREHRAGYLDDEGFTARVMSALPAPAALPAWRKPALAALWAGAGIGIALALPATVGDVAHEILRVILGQRISSDRDRRVRARSRRLGLGGSRDSPAERLTLSLSSQPVPLEINVALRAPAAGTRDHPYRSCSDATAA